MVRSFWSAAVVTLSASAAAQQAPTPQEGNVSAAGVTVVAPADTAKALQARLDAARARVQRIETDTVLATPEHSVAFLLLSGSSRMTSLVRVTSGRTPTAAVDVFATKDGRYLGAVVALEKPHDTPPWDEAEAIEVYVQEPTPATMHRSSLPLLPAALRIWQQSAPGVPCCHEQKVAFVFSARDAGFAFGPIAVDLRLAGKSVLEFELAPDWRTRAATIAAAPDRYVLRLPGVRPAGRYAGQ